MLAAVFGLRLLVYGKDITDFIIELIVQGDMLKSSHFIIINKAVFIILGDFNDFDDGDLCNNISLPQIVTFPTHENNCLDKIITDIEDHYKKPEKHTPIGKSRHCVVLWKPLKQIRKPASKKVTTRPMTDSCMRKFGQWITNETWCVWGFFMWWNGLVIWELALRKV